MDHLAIRSLRKIKRTWKHAFVAVSSESVAATDLLEAILTPDGYVLLSTPISVMGLESLAKVLPPGSDTLTLVQDLWLTTSLEQRSSPLWTTEGRKFAANVEPTIVFTRMKTGKVRPEQRPLLELADIVVPDTPLHNGRQATQFIRRSKKEGKRVVIATGAFDLLTSAHVRFLSRAKAQGDVLVVGVEDDNRVRAQGAFRPVCSIAQRVEVLEALSSIVDFVFVIRGRVEVPLKTFYSSLHATLKADVLAVSEGDPHMDDRREEIEAAGGRIVVVSRHEDGSTTSLLRRALSQLAGTPPVLYSPKRLLLGQPRSTLPVPEQLTLPFPSIR